MTGDSRSICLIVRRFSTVKFDYLTAQELAKKSGVEIVTSNPKVEAFFDKHNFNVYNIEKEYRKFLKSGKKVKITEEFDNIDDIYLPHFYRHRMHIQNKFPPYNTKEDAIEKSKYKKRGEIYLEKWSDYFGDHEIDMVVFKAGGQIINTSGNLIAREDGVSTLHPIPFSVIPNKMFIDNTIWINNWVKREYFEKKPTNSEMERVMNYLNGTVNKKQLVGGELPSIPTYKKAKAFIRAIYIYYFIYKKNFKISPPQILKNYLVHKFRREIAKRYYEKPDFGEDYVFFPWQVTTDTQMTVRGMEFIAQDEVAEEISKNLPKNLTLYVKEHPHVVGFYPLRWIKRMSSLLNVKLVPRETNPHDLIKNAKAVVVINSDVGWEALMHKIPVVTLAQPFYNGFGLTNEAHNGDIGSQINNALENQELDENKIHRLINAVIKSTYPCTMAKNSLGEPNNDPQNIKIFADSLINKYREES